MKRQALLVGEESVLFVARRMSGQKELRFRSHFLVTDLLPSAPVDF